MTSRKKQLQHGSVLESPRQDSALPAEICTVLDVHPSTYTCDVKTDSGKLYYGLAWPAASRDSSGYSGEVNVPKRGQRFTVQLLANEIQLLNAVSTPQITGTPATNHRVFFNSPAVGGTDAIYSGTNTRNYRGSLPPDVMPGDWLRVGTEGNLVGVLEGGVSIIKASETAKVIANSVGDLLQLVGRNMDLHSDFGDIQFRNEDGKVSMTLRGGSQQLTETSTAEKHFTIHADLGNKGELVDFRITNSQGHVLAQVHYHPDGSLETRAAAKQERIDGNSRTTIKGDSTVTIGGKVTQENKLDSTETVTAGRKDITATNGVSITSGQDTDVFAARNVTVGAGQELTLIAGGSALARPGTPAMITTVTNGSWLIDVGNPTAGDIGAARSAFKVGTTLGDISLASTAGTARLTGARMVELGGPPIPGRPGEVGPATFSPVMYEMLEIFFEALGKMLDAHTHSASGSGPPNAPIYATFKQLLKLAQSKRVKVGG